MPVYNPSRVDVGVGEGRGGEQALMMVRTLGSEEGTNRKREAVFVCPSRRTESPEGQIGKEVELLFPVGTLYLLFTEISVN